MILRVRLPDGATVRVEVAAEDTILGLAAKIHSLGKISGDFSLQRDVSGSDPFRNPEATIKATGLNQGDFVFVKGTTIEEDTPEVQIVEPSERKSNGAPAEPNGGTDKRVRTKNCRHGPNGMCAHCAPKEDKRERYQKEIEKWKDRKGTSMAVLEAIDAMKFRVKLQKDPSVTAVSVNRAAAQSFQAYLAEMHFNQQRLGFLYGGLDDERVARIETIYEPPQDGDKTVYRAKTSEDSGDVSERAESVAKMLGLGRTGLIFSTKPRKAILSGIDILTAAQIAVEEEEKYGEEVAKGIVILVVSLAEGNQTLFEAYQLSDQCVEMYKAGVFLPAEQQKANSGRIKTKDEVYVEGKEVTAVHTEFFLMNVPIRDHDSWLRQSFPVENRDFHPQSPSDVGESLRQASSMPFYRRVSDFHLLLFLTHTLDTKKDLPALLGAIREQRELTDSEEGYQLLIESM